MSTNSPPSAGTHLRRALLDAALDRGFLHQGHFSRDYRALFGEHPGERLACP